MAQPRARGGQTEQTGGASSARNTTPSTESGATPARRFSLSRFVPSRVDRTSGGATGTPARTGSFGGVWKLVLTMAIILIAAPVGEYVILLIGKPLKINFNQVIIGKGIPLFGGMTLFTLVYLIYIIAIYIALFKFNIFPRDLFGARAKAEARARERAAQNASSNARASRRASSRHVTTTSSASPSARRVAAAARAETQPAVTGDYDAEHARVKAAQRARRRRETRK